MELKTEHKLDFLKNLTSQDFLNIGLDQVAYIKELPVIGNENRSFSIHAADGSQISLMNSYDKALASVRIKDLHAVTVH